VWIVCRPLFIAWQIMNLETFRWLLSEPGQALLAEAMTCDLSDAAQLRELTRLRRQATPERAAAAYEIAVLRRRAAAKFSTADSLYFTREALEQASGELIAGYRAGRYGSYGTVADLCCGAGGDTLALAGVADVIAVDRDPLRLAMAAANVRALGLADRISFVEADLLQIPAPNVAAIFFDPARRSAGRRVFALSEYQPPVALARRWSERVPAIGIKVAPGVTDEDIAALGDPAREVEFTSVDGELKEALLWHGPLAEPGRRATVLAHDERRRTKDGGRKTDEGRKTEDERRRTKDEGSRTKDQGRKTDEGRKTKDEEPRTKDQGLRTKDQGRTTKDEGRRTKDDRRLVADLQHGSQFTIHNSESTTTPDLSAPSSYLYEPDPAVIRAHVIGQLAEQLGAAQIDREIAYLTADRAIDTPFARCWRVIEWLPWNLKRLRARLRALDSGAVTVKKRGSPLDTDALARQLSGGGARALVVVLTRVSDQPVALICEGPVREGMEAWVD
jgi:SAM-dependent methyltransferase